jgi:hypothetical protein
MPFSLLLVARTYGVSPQEVERRWPLRLTIWAIEAIALERDAEALRREEEDKNSGN